VGYRWFDTKNIDPLFAFGHGLSYTKFEYSNLRLTQARDGVVTAEFEVKNVGSRGGNEVAQLYVQHLKPRLSRPTKELKGFRKIFLNVGESKKLSIALDRAAFAFYDPERRAWAAEKGDYKIIIGASSRDIRLQESLRLSETTYAK